MSDLFVLTVIERGALMKLRSFTDLAQATAMADEDAAALDLKHPQIRPPWPTKRARGYNAWPIYEVSVAVVREGVAVSLYMPFVGWVESFDKDEVPTPV